jgi:hypothetical protein
MATSAGLLQVVTSAVTPVVLISAAAGLILGINQKNTSLADRLRALAVEFRAPATTAARRATIHAQVRLFARRFAYVSFALQGLYAAVVCFVAMVFVITLTPRTASWDLAALGLFVLGVALMLGAVGGEVLETRMAGRTVALEIEDVLAPAVPPVVRDARPRPAAPAGGMRRESLGSDGGAMLE